MHINHERNSLFIYTLRRNNSSNKNIPISCYMICWDSMRLVPQRFLFKVGLFFEVLMTSQCLTCCIHHWNNSKSGESEGFLMDESRLNATQKGATRKAHFSPPKTAQPSNVPQQFKQELFCGFSDCVCSASDGCLLCHRTFSTAERLCCQMVQVATLPRYTDPLCPMQRWCSVKMHNVAFARATVKTFGVWAVLDGERNLLFSWLPFE